LLAAVVLIWELAQMDILTLLDIDINCGEVLDGD